jgi:hypothetical protein
VLTTIFSTVIVLGILVLSMNWATFTTKNWASGAHFSLGFGPKLIEENLGNPIPDFSLPLEGSLNLSGKILKKK